MTISKYTIRVFQEKILSWYKLNKRDLPWRKTRDPYKILVSEVMLQQTQVPRVIPKYEEWLSAFPTVDALAKASLKDVLRIWMGLGYNRRALYLKKAAEAIVKRRGWPETEEELLKLPGIGKYTARALLCFVFGQEVAVVDTNIRKVILVDIIGTNGTKESNGTKSVEKIAEQLLPKGKAYEWNQALMDYSSAILKDKKIPIPKQSKYLGSDRYYRARILKLLLKRGEIAKSSLGTFLREDYSTDLDAWLDAILKKMERDGLIVQRNQKLMLPDH